ncbi:hypothetical protein BS78_K108300 [Paspalum vaginatum]|uniref:Uncharacterized protein n=1 Tax=Paspalum vaginatum TaxID=158149 RepID=A0A9W7X8W2_9POAL|nr:hypothetical protein BS78_K108300 [Paspalum vaginatum]
MIRRRCSICNLSRPSVLVAAAPSATWSPVLWPCGQPSAPFISAQYGDLEHQALDLIAGVPVAPDLLLSIRTASSTAKVLRIAHRVRSPHKNDAASDLHSSTRGDQSDREHGI